MPMTDPVVEQLAAFNARDLERFLACYAPEIVVETGAGDKIVAGIDSMRTLCGQLFLDSPTLYAEVPTRIRAGEFVIDEQWVWGLKLQGFRSEMHAAVVYHLHDGRIAHVRLLV